MKPLRGNWSTTRLCCRFRGDALGDRVRAATENPPFPRTETPGIGPPIAEQPPASCVTRRIRSTRVRRRRDPEPGWCKIQSQNSTATNQLTPCTAQSPVGLNRALPSLATGSPSIVSGEVEFRSRRLATRHGQQSRFDHHDLDARTAGRSAEQAERPVRLHDVDRPVRPLGRRVNRHPSAETEIWQQSTVHLNRSSAAKGTHYVTRSRRRVAHRGPRRGCPQ